MAKIALKAAYSALDAAGEPYKRLLEKEDFDTGLYRPEKIDDQTPHKRDELYIVASGSGEFDCDGNRERFEPGDCFFIAAGIEHRFINFTDDFATWVVFFGARS